MTYYQPYEAMQNKTIEWDGWFDQNGMRQPMTVNNMLVGLNGVVQGGGLHPQYGQFQIQGQVTPHGAITFNKQFQNGSVMQFQGIISDCKITGNWRQNMYAGPFEIKMKLEEWKGSYTMGNQQQMGQMSQMGGGYGGMGMGGYGGRPRTYSIDFNLHVDTNGVFGLDKDSEGVFVIRGQYNNNDFVMQFTKQYLGGNTIYYKGNMTNDGKYWVVSGNWQFAGGSGGTFKLCKEAPPDQQYQQQQQVNPIIIQAPPPVVVQQPVVIVQQQAPGYIPQQAPMMQAPQGQLVQQQIQNQALTGNIEDFEILDGATEDVNNVIELLKRGKKFEGNKLPDFIERIDLAEDVERFMAFVPEYVIDLGIEDLKNCIEECEHRECRFLILRHLYPKLKKKPGAIAKSEMLGLIADEDVKKAEEFLDI